MARTIEEINYIHEKIQSFQMDEKVEDVLVALNNEGTRNELLVMMKVDPNNVIGIERLAKYYFIDLKGDMYMTGMYSNWAKKYGGDTSFVVYHN